MGKDRTRDRRLRNRLRETRTGARHGYAKSKFIRSCVCLLKKKKSPKFTFQKLPPNPQAPSPCLGASGKAHAQKLQQKILNYSSSFKPPKEPPKRLYFFSLTHRIHNIGIKEAQFH